ncbi:phosphoglycerate mutase [Streptomyces showdoensis]|uniref:Phosphoglycerate mutase n=1 Tax=Streptomyces showdoensis TaxID=68268 RepID=A0A2P2GCU9_STREW|nr:histidine phosphatase family protein [Streptomyces showdoensis]KKZ69312.1 phosphoglycerate mutase [Streptomyces showdoensis]
MTVRLTLVAPAMTTALREARFDDAGPVEAGPAGPLTLPAGVRVVSSPSGRCRATAAALGLDLDSVASEPALAGCAMGRWRGRRLDELTAAEPESVAAWLGDPAAAPHGGESLRALRERVADWLDALEPGAVHAFAEPDVIRAAVAHALGAPESVFWRLDVRPLHAVELSGRAGRWNVRLGTPVG